MALRAYVNSCKSGVRVIDRSRAKSSAANVRPEMYGDDVQMAFKSVTERADSMSAMILTGFVEPGAWRSGRVWRSTSVMKCRSLGRSTLGTTMASRWVPRSTVVRSWRAKPELTLLIRTACSRMPATRSRFRIVRMFSRASGFLLIVTESSRS